MTARYLWREGTLIPRLILCDGNIPYLQDIEDPESLNNRFYCNAVATVATWDIQRGEQQTQLESVCKNSE